LPEPERPMQTRSYSGRAGGGPLQQSALKHCQEIEKIWLEINISNIRND
jgi:hypothetical protein